MITEKSPSDDSSALSNKGAQSIHDDDSTGALRARLRQARESARRASNGTANYIKNEPRKAMLIAFALGAALVAVMSLVGRSSGED